MVYTVFHRDFSIFLLKMIYQSESNGGTLSIHIFGFTYILRSTYYKYLKCYTLIILCLFCYFIKIRSSKCTLPIHCTYGK